MAAANRPATPAGPAPQSPEVHPGPKRRFELPGEIVLIRVTRERHAKHGPVDAGCRLHVNRCPIPGELPLERKQRIRQGHIPERVIPDWHRTKTVAIPAVPLEVSARLGLVDIENIHPHLDPAGALGIAPDTGLSCSKVPDRRALRADCRTPPELQRPPDCRRRDRERGVVAPRFHPAPEHRRDEFDLVAPRQRGSGIRLLRIVRSRGMRSPLSPGFPLTGRAPCPYATAGLEKSGRLDLNQRPLGPEPSALNQAELRPGNCTPAAGRLRQSYC